MKLKTTDTIALGIFIFYFGVFIIFQAGILLTEGIAGGFAHYLGILLGFLMVDYLVLWCFITLYKLRIKQ